MKYIKVIAFDADDTLWSNEPFFQQVEKEYARLLDAYGAPEKISDELFQTEMANLRLLGYGAKAFTISMIETAVRVSRGRVSADTLASVIALGKSLLEMPIQLLPDVQDTLERLSREGRYKLVVATKGDLLDQERKLERSGLDKYFDHIEVMSEKKTDDYRKLIGVLRISPEELLMVGNSLKSDIQPVLELGGYGLHVPFEVMWKHERMDRFTHPRLYTGTTVKELLNLFK